MRKRERREDSRYHPGNVLENNGTYRHAYRYVAEDGYGVQGVSLAGSDEEIFIVIAVQRRQKRRPERIDPRLGIVTPAPEPKAYVLTRGDTCWITTE